MMDDLTDIREFYNAAWDAEANRLERHQLEADITWRYLNLYLPPRGRLLEIGFGTGTYTFPLANRGHQITAIDLADEYVTRCKAKAEKLGLSDQIDFRTGDARKLDGIPRGEFDAVLLMGPLYHLLLETDRTATLRSAYACLKPGGVIFSAMISRFGILGDLIKDNPSWIENQEAVWSHIEQGHRPPMLQKEAFGAILLGWKKSPPCMSAWDFAPSKLQVSSQLSPQTMKVITRLKENRETSGWISYSKSAQNKASWLHPDTYSTSDRNQTIKKEVSIRYNGNPSTPRLESYHETQPRRIFGNFERLPHRQPGKPYHATNSNASRKRAGVGV